MLYRRYRAAGGSSSVGLLGKRLGQGKGGDRSRLMDAVYILLCMYVSILIYSSKIFAIRACTLRNV